MCVLRLLMRKQQTRKMCGQRKLFILLATIYIFIISHSCATTSIKLPNAVAVKEFCKTYSIIFQPTNVIKVHIIRSDLARRNLKIGSHTNNVLACLNTLLNAFSQRQSFIRTSNKTLLPDVEEFEIIDNDTAQERTNHEVLMVRQTSTKLDKGVVVITEKLEDLIMHFYLHPTDCCRRCIHILAYTQTNITETSIYGVLKEIWLKFNVLNVIVHCLKSKAKYYLYSYNPFYLR